MHGGIYNLVQMIIMTIQCVANKIHVASSKVKVIICTGTLFIGYNESLLYPAYKFFLHVQNHMARRSVACRDHVTSLKVKVTIQTYAM